MGFDSKCLPENIRKRMSPQDRASLGLHTKEEGVFIENAKSERDLQKQILSFLRLRGIEVCCPRMDRRSTIQTAWPDMTFCYHGFAVVWEVKTPIGKLSNEQEAIVPKLEANGWRHAVIRSVGQAQRFLAELENSNG